ncbi:hypothetical protein [Oceanobacillus kapialis]|uniref:hypothetical protein n=1 Tax=Oceanobacillus kapialis TaxID=481353 RepID=UPI00384F29E6
MKKIIGLIIVLTIALFLGACSESTSSEEPKEEETESSADTEAAEETEESAIPEDDELFAVLEANIQTMMDQDKDAHMETIHSESPSYDSTDQLWDQMAVYTLDMELSDLSVEEKTEGEATVSYTQTSMKVDGPEYQNNLTKGVHTLKPEDGVWKIYSSVAEETIPLDENGEEMEQGEASGGGATGEAAMEGEYAEFITSLEMPFDSDKWVLGNYAEAQGEGVAEFLANGENFQNYTEMLTVHVYPELTSQDNSHSAYVDMMETNLNSMIDGELEFNRIEEANQEIIYEFSVTGDSTMLDQEEVARAFIKDGMLFVVRYTAMEGMIENKDEWLEKIKQVK